jgi:hypothetical protein
MASIRNVFFFCSDKYLRSSRHRPSPHMKWQLLLSDFNKNVNALTNLIKFTIINSMKIRVQWLSNCFTQNIWSDGAILTGVPKGHEV